EGSEGSPDRHKQLKVRRKCGHVVLYATVDSQRRRHMRKPHPSQGVSVGITIKHVDWKADRDWADRRCQGTNCARHGGARWRLYPVHHPVREVHSGAPKCRSQAHRILARCAQTREVAVVRGDVRDAGDLIDDFVWAAGKPSKTKLDITLGVNHNVAAV